MSEQGELATSRAPVRRERPPPQWVAPPPGFELDTSGESSSTWASWRAAAEAAQAEQEAVQERLERGEPVRDMTAERNFWRSAAAELGAPLDPGRTASELSTAAGGLPERPSEHNRSEEIGSIDSNIPESDEEWDPDTSWMQMYASDAVEFVSGTESADDNLQGTLWGAALGSEQAARERSSTSLQSLSAEWDTKERIPDSGAEAADEEETLEPRDPKKETAFWRGAAQDIIESLPTQIEPGVDAQSSASTPAVPDTHAGTGDPDVTAEEPVGPAEAWAAWRAARASSKNVSALPAPVAETHPEPLSETEIWIQWREQQRKTWAGALNDLNRNRPREQQVARPEKSTVDRWRHVAAELSQDSPQSEENS